MGFRFRRSIKILPGVRINLGKTGASVSIGPRGLKTTISKDGVRHTYGLPGSGISYTEFNRFDKPSATNTDPIASLTVEQLKELLRAKGLHTSGRKAELVQRIYDNYTPGELGLPASTPSFTHSTAITAPAAATLAPGASSPAPYPASFSSSASIPPGGAFVPGTSAPSVANLTPSAAALAASAAALAANATATPGRVTGSGALTPQTAPTVSQCYCKNCGCQLNGTVQYCPNCGQKQPPSPPSPQPPQVAAPTSQPAATSEASAFNPDKLALTMIFVVVVVGLLAIITYTVR